MSELYPGSLQLPAMRYQSTPAQSIVDKVMISTKWGMQEKKDGAWYMLEKIDNECIYLFGRTKSKVTGELTEKGANVPHIMEWAKKYLPDGTTLIGEICIPGGHSSDVTKIMGCLPEKAIERQEKQGNVHYRVFDCIKWCGEDYRDEEFQNRYHVLEYSLSDIWNDEINYLDLYTVEDLNIGKVIEYWDVDHWEKPGTFQYQLNKIFAAGGEGAVFKPLDSKYYPDKRPALSKGGSFKMKEHVDSVDLVCTALLDPEMEYTGKEIETWPYWQQFASVYDSNDNIVDAWCSFEEGSKYKEYLEHPDGYRPVTKHYYYGWKNGMRLGVYDKDGNLIDMGRVASGLNDALREDMANNPDKYIGKVVECSCMSIDKEEHSLRHPVFLRMRDDKDASECLFEEI